MPKVSVPASLWINLDMTSSEKKLGSRDPIMHCVAFIHRPLKSRPIFDKNARQHLKLACPRNINTV